MQKILTEKVKVKKLRMALEYYLIQEGDIYGIEIRDDGGNSAARLIPDTKENVQSFLEKLARNTVMPISLDDIVNDYITTKWINEKKVML